MRNCKIVTFFMMLFFILYGITSAQTNFFVSAECPQAVNGTIGTSTDFNVDIYIDNQLDPAEDWCGGGFSFIFYSPDVTITDITHVSVDSDCWWSGYPDYSSDIECLNGFDTMFDFLRQVYEFGWDDGVLPDSINFQFAGNECMPVSAPNQAYIRFNMNIDQEGTFCVDSLDLGGPDDMWDWLFWSWYHVEFAGPYCWSITPCVDDADCDGILTADDNCPLIANANQADIDDDGFGDVCDNCPFHSNAGQIDSNLDDIGDACTFEEPTPAGLDVSIALGTDVEMLYENVISAGVTQLTETIIGQTETNFKIIPIELSKYLNITTTTSPDGEIETCITYDDTGMDDMHEDSLILRHFDGLDWIVITSSLNTTTNVICGSTYSLSSFAVGGPDYICGDVYVDEIVNIIDIVFIINYKYKGGPPAFLYAGMDVNNDDLINILDIVYLINYKYKGGPEPICW